MSDRGSIKSNHSSTDLSSVSNIDMMRPAAPVKVKKRKGYRYITDEEIRKGLKYTKLPPRPLLHRLQSKWDNTKRVTRRLRERIGDFFTLSNWRTNKKYPKKYYPKTKKPYINMNHETEFINIINDINEKKRKEKDEEEERKKQKENRSFKKSYKIRIPTVKDPDYYKYILNMGKNQKKPLLVKVISDQSKKNKTKMLRELVNKSLKLQNSKLREEKYKSRTIFKKPRKLSGGKRNRTVKKKFF